MSSIKPFGTRAWRKRMGLTREQAADCLGVSVYTIKSYEIGQRQVPIPTRRLMARLEGERGEASAGQPGACVIGGGGSVGSGRRGLDLVARPSPEIAKLSNAILSAHDIPARLILTSEQDPDSNTTTDQDLAELAESLVQDPDIFTIIWGAWTAGEASGDMQSAETLAIEQTLSRRPSNQCLVRVATLLAQPGFTISQDTLMAEAKRISGVCRAEVAIVHDGVRAALWSDKVAQGRVDTDLELVLATGVAMALGLDEYEGPEIEPVLPIENPTRNKDEARAGGGENLTPRLMRVGEV